MDWTSPVSVAAWVGASQPEAATVVEPRRSNGFEKRRAIAAMMDLEKLPRDTAE